MLKGAFIETTYVCVLTRQISSFYHNSKEIYTGGGVILAPTPPLPQKKPLKSLPRLGLIKCGLIFSAAYNSAA